MAGRKKLMARRVDGLAARASDLSADTFLAAPPMFLRAGAHSPQAVAWQAAVDQTIAALEVLDRLAEMTHQRAGLAYVSKDPRAKGRPVRRASKTE